MAENQKTWKERFNEDIETVKRQLDHEGKLAFERILSNMERPKSTIGERSRSTIKLSGNLKDKIICSSTDGSGKVKRRLILTNTGDVVCVIKPERLEPTDETKKEENTQKNIEMKDSKEADSEIEKAINSSIQSMLDEVASERKTEEDS